MVASHVQARNDARRITPTEAFDGTKPRRNILVLKRKDD